MSYYAKVIEHSVNEAGEQCFSVECRYPRFIHSEIMTHRALSKSSASSRAIPVKKMIKQIWHYPATPLWFGKTMPGMQAKEELPYLHKRLAYYLIYYSRYFILALCWVLLKIGLHKQIANRYLEAWSWITVIMTFTLDAGISNFFSLRYHPAAQPEFKYFAGLLRKAIATSNPRQLKTGEWHLPYVLEDEREHFPSMTLCKISAGRSCRVSYLNHDGTKNVEKDIALAESITEAGHMGALEHTCMATPNVRHGNLTGFKQYRKTLQAEYDFGLGIAYQKIIEWLSLRGIPFSATEHPFYFIRKTMNRYNFNLPKYGILTPAAIGLGAGELPDFFHVFLMREPKWDRKQESKAYRCFLVQVPGLEKSEEHPIHEFMLEFDDIYHIHEIEEYRKHATF